MSGGGETARGADFNKMVGTCRTVTGTGRVRYRDGDGGIGGRIRLQRRAGCGGLDGMGGEERGV